MPVINQILLGIEQLLYPPKCVNCGAYLEIPPSQDYSLEACFCNQCAAAGFFPINKPYCTQCGLQLPRPILKNNKNRDNQATCENHVCESCLKTHLKLGKVRASGQYQGILKDGIHLFKYQSKLSLAKAFEHMMFKTFERHFEKQDINIIMPVPLHKKRLISRGFNQAFILVRNFNRHYKQKFGQPPSWQIDARVLVRSKKTAPQTGFDITQRKNNLKGAFRVKNRKAVENQHILLVDDVFTTGATCNEAAKELLKNGASKVDALVLART